MNYIRAHTCTWSRIKNSNAQNNTLIGVCLHTHSRAHVHTHTLHTHANTGTHMHMHTHKHTNTPLLKSSYAHLKYNLLHCHFTKVRLICNAN